MCIFACVPRSAPKERDGAGSVALFAPVEASRGWAAAYPLARQKAPLSCDSHLTSTFVVEPLRVADRALRIDDDAEGVNRSRLSDLGAAPDLPGTGRLPI